MNRCQSCGTTLTRGIMADAETGEILAEQCLKCKWIYQTRAGWEKQFNAIRLGEIIKMIVF
jgi:phage FluMu protein Com